MYGLISAVSSRPTHSTSSQHKLAVYLILFVSLQVEEQTILTKCSYLNTNGLIGTEHIGQVVCYLEEPSSR